MGGNGTPPLTVTKLKIYKAALRPIITYASETTFLTTKVEEKLRKLERKTLRRILGPKMIQGEYRSLMNHA